MVGGQKVGVKEQGEERGSDMTGSRQALINPAQMSLTNSVKIHTATCQSRHFCALSQAMSDASAVRRQARSDLESVHT